MFCLPASDCDLVRKVALLPDLMSVCLSPCLTVPVSVPAYLCLSVCLCSYPGVYSKFACSGRPYAAADSVIGDSSIVICLGLHHLITCLALSFSLPSSFTANPRHHCALHLLPFCFPLLEGLACQVQGAEGKLTNNKVAMINQSIDQFNDLFN